jgi:hypothetical protein
MFSGGQVLEGERTNPGAGRAFSWVSSSTESTARLSAGGVRKRETSAVESQAHYNFIRINL